MVKREAPEEMVGECNRPLGPVLERMMMLMKKTK
jgi:hypothetical protein